MGLYPLEMSLVSTNSVPLSRTCQEFVNHIRYERGLATTTVSTYQAWLRHFQRWLESEKYPDELVSFTEEALRKYQQNLYERHLRPRTIISALDALRGFGVFLVERGDLSESPVHKIRRPKKDAARRVVATEGEIKALLSAVELLYPERTKILVRAMLYTLVFTGVRFQEWLQLRTSDVGLENGTLLIQQGKGRKSRMLHPPDECMGALRVWLEERAKMNCKLDWLWMANISHHMSDVKVREMLERVKTIAGLADKKHVQPHSLRHAFATRLLQNGAHMKTIQAALGHEGIRTTEIYLHAGEEMAKLMAQYASIKPPVTPAEPTPPQPVNQSHKGKATLFNRLRRQSSKQRR